MEENKRTKRKNQITLMMKLYFEKVDYLKDKDLDEWTKKALDTFLDSDLSIDEINDQISYALKNKKNEFSIEEKEEKENYMKFMFVEDEESITNNEDKAKQLVKTSDDLNEAGFVNNIIITTLALITFSLSAIGMALIYLLQ